MNKYILIYIIIKDAAAVCISLANSCRVYGSIVAIVCICCWTCGRHVCCPVAADQCRSQAQIDQNLLTCSCFNPLKIILDHRGENMLKAEFRKTEFPWQLPSGRQYFLSGCLDKIRVLPSEIVTVKKWPDTLRRGKLWKLCEKMYVKVY